MELIAMTPFSLKRRAIKAHATRSHQRKWLQAASYLRARGLWILEQRQERRT